MPRNALNMKSSKDSNTRKIVNEKEDEKLTKMPYENSCKIQYKIEPAKIKNIYIKIKDGEVVVRCSPKVEKKYIEEILNKKSEWINKKLKEYNKEKESENLEKIQILGNEYNVKILYKDIKKVDVSVEDEVEISFPKYFENREISQKLKNNIKDAIYKKVTFEETKIAMEKYTELTGFVPKQWRIRKINNCIGSVRKRPHKC